MAIHVCSPERAEQIPGMDGVPAVFPAFRWRFMRATCLCNWNIGYKPLFVLYPEGEKRGGGDLFLILVEFVPLKL